MKFLVFFSISNESPSAVSELLLKYDDKYDDDDVNYDDDGEDDDDDDDCYLKHSNNFRVI
jgi:hypothetical protein